jgi:hypothetical protein
MKKPIIYFFICLFSWLLVWGINYMNKKSNVEVEQGYTAIPIGEKWKIEFKGHAQSVSGLSKTLNSNVELIIGNDTLKLKSQSAKNDDWSNGIEVEQLKVKGVSISDYEDPISNVIEVRIPRKLSKYTGSKGLMTFKLLIEYPILSYPDNIVNRTLKSTSEYRNTTKEFNFTENVIPVLAEKKIEIPRIAFILSRGLAVLTSIVFLFSILFLFKNKSKG